MVVVLIIVVVVIHILVDDDDDDDFGDGVLRELVAFLFDEMLNSAIADCSPSSRQRPRGADFA